MDSTTVTFAEAKAHLSQLTERAAAGETVIITKRGKPVAQLSRPATSRKPVGLAMLRRLTESMPKQSEEADRFMRRLRDEARY
ncbi:type II toxin-antitoxin system Phd/YefM family antitoxin [Nitrococcus mobilis]|nr:type II toxin-antitoxin system prevent-host-death family antitoxin [Nitrococcus mobilis]